VLVGYLDEYSSTLVSPCVADLDHSIMAPPRANLTGFDVRKLVASSGTPAKDPWGRMYEAFRHSSFGNYYQAFSRQS